MIDRTSSRIEEQEGNLRRRNLRRYAFHRMLAATDRMLWRLEELNRDEVRTGSPRLRAELRSLADSMPAHVGEPLHDSGQVQDILDSLFEVQERLFRWRYPGWKDFDPEGDEIDLVS